MANFNQFFPTLMKFEGGYVNDPDDHGGATNWGVTLAEWVKYGNDKNDDGVIDYKDMKLLTQDDAVKIAKPFYWDKIKGDQIVSQSVAELLCDFAYNSGTGTAVKKIQKVIGVDDDGIMGDQTLAAINAGQPEEIFAALKQSRINFVNAIVDNNPSQQKFLKGWLYRINSFNFKSSI